MDREVAVTGPLELFGVREFADAVGVSYLSMSRRLGRGELPDPDAVAGSRVFWFRGTISAFADRERRKERVDG